MRSQLVFDASEMTANRFALCSSVFLAVRKLHRDNTSMPNSINQAMTFCSVDRSIDRPAAAAIAEESIA